MDAALRAMRQRCSGNVGTSAEKDSKPFQWRLLSFVLYIAFADTINKLSAAERLRRGAAFPAAARLTRDRNSEFRIPNSELNEVPN